MLHSMQLAHPRHMDIYDQNSKHKSQNTEVTSFEHRTQNTMSHIGFRNQWSKVTWPSEPGLNLM